jgi:N4-gp56 family major capsid protein
MAVTSFGVNDPLAVKLWAKTLSVEVLKATWASKFMGEGTDSIIQVRDETSKGAGDKITYGLRMQLAGLGVIGDGTLEGNEESLTTYTDSLVINQLRHAVRSAGRMSQQRVPFSIRQEALSGLRDWWTNRIDLSFMNQICCNTAESNYVATTGTQNTGLQATFTLPTVQGSADVHYLSMNQTTSGDENITSANLMSITMADRMVERATGSLGLGTANPGLAPVRPVKVDGSEWFLWFLHPYQVTDIRTNTSTGQWLDIQKAAMTGGEVSDNPIFSGALGAYNNVILHKEQRISTGVSSASASTAVPTVRRSVFAGAQAATMAFGRESGKEKYTWVEELFDYENQLGVSAGCILGLKATTFNNSVFGLFVGSSYAAQH